MAFFLLGINHDSAPVAVREKFAIAPENQTSALLNACEAATLEEIVLLSTCNRTEVYAVNKGEQDNLVGLKQWLAEVCGVTEAELDQYSYNHTNEEAIEHTIHVASGLDSMVLGEPQIFGQLKSAYALAVDVGTVKSELQRVFPHCFSVAKSVRTNTAIGENPVSVAYTAVDLCRRIFADLHNTRALLIGAGETIELVAKHVQEAGVEDITVVNRTLSNALAVAEPLGAHAGLLADIPDLLPTVDIVFTSTASQLPILGKGAVESALKSRRNQPMFMVDLAVPRDIEEQVGELKDIYLYTVDDLRGIVDDNIQQRQSAVADAKQIISRGLAKFLAKRKADGSSEAISAMRDDAEQMRQQELVKVKQMLARGDSPELVVERLSNNLVNKLLHKPTLGLKNAGENEQTNIIDWAYKLYAQNEKERNK